MIFEYKLIKLNNSALPKLGKEGWELTAINNDIMYFKKCVKQTKNIVIEKESKERLEFIKLYRVINNNGSYAETLIKKYHEAIKEKSHEYMINKLEEYKSHLKVFTSKPPLQVGTYLNQKRYNDSYEVIKVDYTKKRRSDMIIEQKIPEMYIEPIKLEAEKWDSNHGATREMTSGNFQQIIDKYYKPNR